jgi:hypothetical protein
VAAEKLLRQSVLRKEGSGVQIEHSGHHESADGRSRHSGPAGGQSGTLIDVERRCGTTTGDWSVHAWARGELAAAAGLLVSAAAVAREAAPTVTTTQGGGGGAAIPIRWQLCTPVWCRPGEARQRGAGDDGRRHRARAVAAATHAAGAGRADGG